MIGFIGSFISCAPRTPSHTQQSPRKACQYTFHARSCNKVASNGLYMSGVNGGIDYDLDISELPESVASHVKYVQGGPDSPTALIEAAYAIAQSKIPSTLPVLVDMLGFNNPIAANIAIDALVDAKQRSIPYLLKGVGAFNYAVSAYALRALGRIRDPSVVDICIECAKSGPIPNVRRAACNSLSLLQFTSENDLHRAATLFAELLGDYDWSVRYASIAAIENLMTLPEGKQDIKVDFVTPLKKVAEEDADPTVSHRAALALAALDAALAVKA